MDIQSGYYEAGIVLFWLLFAYLFMDKFLFRGGLGEICFGKMRRRMAKVCGALPDGSIRQKKNRRKDAGVRKEKRKRKKFRQWQYRKLRKGTIQL